MRPFPWGERTCLMGILNVTPDSFSGDGLMEGDLVMARAREMVEGFDWGGTVSAEAMEKAAAQGGFGARTEGVVKIFTGRPHAMILSGIALMHPATHIGEAATVRSAGGFGTGV